MPRSLKLQSEMEYKLRNDVIGRFSPNIGPGTVGLVPDSDWWPLHEGTIVDVSANTHTCVAQLDDGRTLREVSWASPIFCCLNGSGVYTMPEVNSRVILGHFNNGMWYILGYVPMFAEFENWGSINGRANLQQGDIVLSTAHGSTIEIRNIAEQIVLRNGPNFIWMETTGNRISAHSQRMTVRTDAGTMTMETDAQARTTTTLLLKRKVDDKENFIKIIAGYTGHNPSVPSHAALPKNASVDEVVLYINVCDKFKLTIDTSGNLKIAANSITEETLKHISRTSAGIISDNSADEIHHTRIPLGGICSSLGGSEDTENSEFMEPPKSYPYNIVAGPPDSPFTVGKDRLGLGGNGAYGGSGGYGGDMTNYTNIPGTKATVNGIHSSPDTPRPAPTSGLSGVDRIIDYTAINEGGGHYDAWTANDNGAGVSYGLVQFNQKKGTLPTLLRRMHDKNPQLFEHYMGEHTQNMLNENWVRTANLNDPGIKARMIAAARDPEFMAVQRQLANEGYMSHVPNQALKYMGISNPSERTMAMLFDANIQKGPQGASNLLARAVNDVGGKGAGERAIMARFAQLADTERYDNNRRTRIFLDPAFSDEPFSG